MTTRPTVEGVSEAVRRYNGVYGFHFDPVEGAEPFDVVDARDYDALRQQLAEMRGAARELIDANERWGLTMRRKKAIERYNAALAPTSQPSRGKCERCGGKRRVQDEEVGAYWPCPDCAQPERQGAEQCRCDTITRLDDEMRCLRCGCRP